MPFKYNPKAVSLEKLKPEGQRPWSVGDIQNVARGACYEVPDLIPFIGEYRNLRGWDSDSARKRWAVDCGRALEWLEGDASNDNHEA